jgi:hypothetical protein
MIELIADDTATEALEDLRDGFWPMLHISGLAPDELRTMWDPNQRSRP